MNEDQLLDQIDRGEIGNVELLESGDAPEPPEEVERERKPRAKATPAPTAAPPPVTEIDEEHCAYLLEVVKLEPRHLGTLKIFGTRKNIRGDVVEAVVAHLVRQKRLEPFRHWKKGKCYRLPGTAADATAEKHGVATAAPIPPPKKKEPHVAKAPQEWIPASEAATMLDISRTFANRLAATGKLKGRKVGDGERAPWEVLRSSVIAYAPDFMSDGATPSPPSKEKAVRKVRKPKAIDQVAAKHAKSNGAIAADVEAQVRWVVDGYKLGRFEPAQALEQIVELLG